MNHFIKGWFKHLTNNKISNFAFVSSTSKISTKASIYRFVKIKNSVVGDYSYIGPSCDITNTSIGKFCSIADNCRIGTASHTVNNISSSPIFTLRNNATKTTWTDKSIQQNNEVKRVNIGNDVWIATHVIIKGGITIGDGAIIGAGAVVVKDVPPYSIVGGIPAKVIKYRFSEDIIKKLEEIKWWNISDENIKKIIEFFQSEDITIEKLEELERLLKL